MQRVHSHDDEDLRPPSPDAGVGGTTGGSPKNVSFLNQPNSRVFSMAAVDDMAFDELVAAEGMKKKSSLLNIQRSAKMRSNSVTTELGSISEHGSVSGSVDDDSPLVTHEGAAVGVNNSGGSGGGKLAAMHNLLVEPSPRRRANSKDTSGKESEKDIRDDLFNEIPMAYPHSTNFQKVLITEDVDAATDADRLDSCNKLLQCMNLREKWLGSHPVPPQDQERFEADMASGFKSTSSFHRVSQDNLLQCGSSSTAAADTAGPAMFFAPPPPPAAAVAAAAAASPSPPTKVKKEFRRRKEPHYNVLEQPLPLTVGNLRFKMMKGVMVVKETEVSMVARQNNGIADFCLSYIAGDASGTTTATSRSKAPLSALTGGISTSDSAASFGGLSLDTPEPTPTGTSSQVEGGGFASVRAAAEEDDENESMEDTNVQDWSDSLYKVGSFEDFVDDFYTVRRVVNFGGAGSYAYKRLSILQAKFNLHVLLNEGRESSAQKSVPHRDFYNVRKVDTHVHHSACMNQKHLLRFIKHKLRVCPDEAVVFRDGQFLTLGEVFKSLNLTAYDLSIDTLDMHANNTFHRFDRFNLKYNPAGQSRLREIFLKTDNVISGRYLAEITKEVMSDLDQSKYQLVEWRLSIYGRKPSEWATLARWVYVNKLVGPNVSIDPSSNPPLHYFLQTVVGFDSVDDESKPESDRLSYGPGGLPTPDLWTNDHNPPYAYWMYYTYANICILNKLRAQRGLCTFQFRPHCGEAGDPDHLIATYLVAHQINHGILLRKNAGLQYLYYLSQVGMALSPLSNNKLFLDYNKSPFLKYFQIGMNVTLSTDDPLMLHYTKDPLLEEYSVAAQVWKLSSTDQCEIARRSVLQSGWEDRFKKHFLGEDYSDIRETNVPEIRLAYRQEALSNEMTALRIGQSQSVMESLAPPTPAVPPTILSRPPLKKAVTTRG